MTVAKLAQGFTVEFGGTPIPEVVDFTIGVDTAEVDVTSHDSPDQFREFIAGLKDPTPVTLTVNWDISSHGFLFDIAGDSSAVDTLTFEEPDASDTYSVEAWVKGYSIHGPATGAAETGDIVFRTTGAFTRAGS